MIIKKIFDNKNISEKSNILLDEINKSFKNKLVMRYCRELSKDISIPEKEIIFYFKKKLSNSYDFKKNQFTKTILSFSIIKYIIGYIFFIITIFLFKKNTNSFFLTKYDLLIDDVKSLEELSRYKNLQSYFKKNSVAVRVNEKAKFKNKLYNIFYRKNFFNYEIKIKDLLFFINFFYKNIIYSYNTKINFYYLSMALMNDYYYFSSLFNDYKFKYVISSRHYSTNNIKNYILKKRNTKTCIIQKNIDVENMNGFFIDSDILFVLGNKIKIKKKRFFNIKEQFPVGSFFMEHIFYNKKIKKDKIIESFDILCLGSNEQYPGGTFDNDNDHMPNYIEHLNWLKKISYQFPKLKVGFKHHDNNKNNFEKIFFKNTNVVYINKKINSYDLCYKSKFLCSWASTMIIELFSINKRGFFLDPHYKNIQYMKNINKNIRINTYSKFKKIFFNISNKEKINLKNYCANSKNTSQKIFNYLISR